jgi:uncharacterized membrane protein
MARFDARARCLLLAIALAATAYFAGFVVVPWLESRGLAAGSWLRLAYRPTCHQIPDRCLDLGTGPLAVCARCSGLSAGGLAGILISGLLGIRLRPRIWWLAVALAPSALDFALALAGLPSLSNWPRFLIAMPPGTLLGLLLADAVGDVVGRVGPTGSGPGEDPVQ